MPDNFIFWTGILLSIGLTTSSLEMLAIKQLYISGGLMNWELSKLRATSLLKSKWLNFIYKKEHFIQFSIFRLLAALILFSACIIPASWWVAFGFLFSFWAYLLFTLRTPYGLDGSDQAALLVALIYSILCFTESKNVQVACHIFLAAQLSLVYFTSGWNKLKAAPWRNGEYLWKLFSTGFYGMQNLGVFLEKHKTFARFASLSIVLFETFFILYWIIPAPYCWILLACLGIFHLATAITMGLNTFFWAFLSMYPSTIYCRLLY
jgi:hypothetical protein